ncbi:hypothetical protein M9H77_16081 [Catharanthus roseus]|uniref:Uncharacterized protein n=1 Tax=Catharanthus roseus TaxID=4058 RepID=A0ACC0B0Y3_CATRO|nr:hypothetical protein M9H77_16081 [Catharanthus roseus]
MACDIYYILGENPDFYNPFPLTLYHVFYPVHCSCLEDEMLNYNKHISKSPHARPDKNSIDVINDTINVDRRFDHINSFSRICDLRRQIHLIRVDKLAVPGGGGV